MNGDNDANCKMSLKSHFAKIFAAILAAWSSKKLWATLLGVAILQSLFWHGAFHLITYVPNEKIAAYEAMFQTNHYAIVLAILSFLGVQGMTDVFRRTTSSVTEVVNEFITENKTAKEEIIYKEELERGD